jgi:hypothetical protein
VDVIGISPEMDTRRETFLHLMFEGGEGNFFCIAYGPRNGDRRKFREEFFQFPSEVPQALELINEVHQGHNVWFSPMLYERRKRVKETVVFTPCAWADADTCEPEFFKQTPTIVLETSPGRYATFWMFERPADPDDAEELSQRIAYAHSEDGADRTGWNLAKLLRFPFTYNYKYASTPIVKVVEANRKRYRLDDFDYPEIATFAYSDIPMPDITGIDGLDLLENKRLQMTPTIWRLYQEQLPEGQSWSEPLWKLELLLFEAGFDKAQVFCIVQDAACNKYEKKGMPLRLLWKDVCRAEAKYLERALPETHPTPAGMEVEPLVTDEERDRVLSTDTFIERYITWAKSLGDAAPQYHQAGAFTVLSALLAGAVQLPTSFGVIKPNLWFMILADTTLTRKSTAMDIAMDLTLEVDDDVVMATDGSLEGLLTSLSTRPGRPSVFLRDEFSGLLEQMTKKDYMSGMPELLTKLYDGKFQKRVLRKEQVEVKDPCLIVFAGGIKDKVTSLLSFEQVSSGFIPRFIIITAESDITRVRPLGPPTDWTDNNRTAMVEEIQQLKDYYDQTTKMMIQKTNIVIDTKKKFDAQLTPEAWSRYNRLETQLLDAGIASDRQAVMTPVFDRLAKSILKAAVLLAASRKKSDPVVVEEDDIVRAAVYGENWRTFVVDIMSEVGTTSIERELASVVRMINKHPGITRARLMQNFHFDARRMSVIADTLEQRGQIMKESKGRGYVYWPIEIRFKEVESDG